MRTISCILFCFVVQIAFAQLPPANLDQFETQDWLWENYYVDKHRTYEYGDARYEMYSFIDNPDVELVCVYSGYSMEWSPNNPSNNPAPINCEHTVPRSFYDEAYPMFSDMHHLFPTYNRWNSARWNYRFGEVDDDRTESWMYLDISQSYIPTSNIDAYSEVKGNSFSNALFEPREDHKGDLARSIFYFYTMYPDVGDIEGVANFNTLCEWNHQDKVSEKEMERNNRVETVQGTRNPFVDYPELTIQAWGCPVFTSTEEIVENSNDLRISPNPAQNYIEFETSEKGLFNLQIFDLNGQLLVAQEKASNIDQIDIKSLPKGFYMLQLEQNGKRMSQKFAKI